MTTSLMPDAVRRIFETELPIRPNEPSLRDYYGDLRSPELLEKWVRYHEDMLLFADIDPQGVDVLDVGSGFGLVLVWMASRGARAEGLEIVPWKVDDVRGYLPRLPDEIRERVNVEQGSASHMPYDDSSFDLVLAIEAVSHYLDYDRFLAEAHRVLRPGAKLLVVDGNNGLNPAVRRHCEKIWAQHEQDVGEGGSPWLFVSKRQEIIETHFPQIEPSEAHMLALRTSGMVRAQIVDAVATYVESGDLPTNVYKRGELTVHPEQGMVMERLFNPYALAREIRAKGFGSKVRGYWGGAGGSPILRAANRTLAAFSPLTMFTARSFRIVAEKR